MSNVDGSLVDLIETAAKAAVQRSLIETIVPIIRHGTVADVDTNTYIHDVQMDGDSTSIQVHDILQMASGIGDRVTVMFAPPHQAMIIGQPIHDEWHLVGGINEVPFTTGWGNDPSGDNPGFDSNPNCMYRRRGQFVEVRGSALRTSGSSNTIFVMPEGYRPANDIGFYGSNALTGAELLTAGFGGSIIHPAGGNGPFFFSTTFTVA